jgi:hypothetical protein
VSGSYVRWISCWFTTVQYRLLHFQQGPTEPWALLSNATRCKRQSNNGTLVQNVAPRSAARASKAAVRYSTSHPPLSVPYPSHRTSGRLQHLQAKVCLPIRWWHWQKNTYFKKGCRLIYTALYWETLVHKSLLRSTSLNKTQRDFSTVILHLFDTGGGHGYENSCLLGCSAVTTGMSTDVSEVRTASIIRAISA